MNIIALLGIMGLLLDQLVKLVVKHNLFLGQSISIIPNFFSITYVENDGAAWSLFRGNRLFLVLVAIAFLVILYRFFIYQKSLRRIDQICFGLLIAGVLGNLVDRLFGGAVIDYFDVLLGKYQYPIFNLADCFIVIAVIIMVIRTLKGSE